MPRGGAGRLAGEGGEGEEAEEGGEGEAGKAAREGGWLKAAVMDGRAPLGVACLMVITTLLPSKA